MVVFTCSHCGESVKKNQVEKHYSFTRCCNSFPALTCVDCLKDFNGDEYNGHISCVTEQERYSAKGFVAKPPSDKGKRKQENWTHFIKRILDSNVDGHVRNLLKRIANDPGIPQKKIKFLNFCKSKFSGGFSHSDFEKTWEFLEGKKEEWQKEMSSQSNNQINGESAQEDRKRKRIDSNNESKENNENSDKKKTKQKQEKEDNLRESLNEVGGTINKEARSKKNKKNKSSPNSEIHENEEDNCDEIHVDEVVVSESANGNEVCDLLSKKEKKEKRKKEKYEKQLLEIQNEPVHGDEEQEDSVESSEKRKKKKKREENGGIEGSGAPVKISNKKKRRQPDIETIENMEDTEEQVEVVSDTKPAKFNWEETVVKVLESKGELPLKRVEKKVVTEYINSGVHVESMEKVIAKFNKKILKMSKVKVKKEIVKLVNV